MKIALIAAIAAAVVGISGTGYLAWDRNETVERLRQALSVSQAEAETLRDTAEDRAARGLKLEQDLARRQAEIAALEAAKAAATQTQQSLLQQMRDALKSRDVTISELQGKLTVNILDRVLFDSGRADIKPEGQEVLRQIAAVLDKVPNRQILVTGHTDNVPVQASRHLFATNWELSIARAAVAVRFLAEKAGVEPTRLGAVGYGEYRPVAPNDSAEGRAQNRRIAVVVLAEDIVPSDTGRPPAGATATIPAQPSAPTP